MVGIDEGHEKGTFVLLKVFWESALGWKLFVIVWRKAQEAEGPRDPLALAVGRRAPQML